MHILNEKYRKALRLKGFDYSKSGLYFITICTIKKECLLGKIVNSKLTYTELGEIVNETIFGLPDKFTGIRIESFIVMPNHVHLLIRIVKRMLTSTKKVISGKDNFIPEKKYVTSGDIIRYLKAVTTYKVNKQAGISKLWQRNYYDKIIRNQNQFNKIYRYIVNNPADWEEDEYNPDKNKR